MFCSGCGMQIQSGLIYCSRCGRRVADDVQSGGNLANPLFIAACTAGIGFVSFALVLRVLVRSGVAPDVFIPVTFFYFAALFGICFMMMRGTSRNSQKEQRPEMPFAERVYLSPVDTAQLQDAREFGIGSVTDATTRTLDEVKIDRRQN